MGFLNGALLGGAALITLPILIHLLNRRRFQIVRWAAMDFLLEAQRENRRRVKIEELLVLFLRCLAILLLALLLARPTMTQQGLGFLPGLEETIERIVILDDSGSMNFRSGRATSFQRARTMLTGLIEDVRQEREGDLLTVIRASAPEAAELRMSNPRSEDTERFLARLGEAEPTQGVLDLPRLIRNALGDDPSKAPGKAVLYVITDLRRRDWIGDTGDLPKRIAAAVRESGRSTDGALRVLVLDVGGSGTRNLGVVGLKPVEKLAMAGLPYELEVRIKNYGDQPVYEVPLTLETADGRVPLEPVKSIAGGQTAVVRHRTTFLEQGAQSVTVRLGEDSLPLDDTRHLAFTVTEQLSALLVDGDREEGPLGSEAALLRMAMAPPGDFLSGIEPTIVLAEDMSGEDLADYDSLVLCNLERWPLERQEELERFVKRGGGLAVFLGDRMNLEAYDQALYRGGKGLLPAKLEAIQTVESEDKRPNLAPPPEDHALTRVFAGERNPFLSRVRARRWSSLVKNDERDSTSQVVLRLTDASATPFVIEKPFGRGRVILFNTTADNAWSNFPKNISWPVVAQELVRLLAPSATRGLNLRCGEPLQRLIDQARDMPRVQVKIPGQRRARDVYAEQLEDKSGLRVTLDDTRLAGIYALTLTSLKGESRKELLAVNVDPGEGDLTRALPEQVKAGLEGVSIEFRTGSEESALLTITDGTRTELWRTFLLALFCVFLLEQVLAWRAAHHRAPLGGAA
jgi:uncharacterized membrane protein